MKLQFYHQIQKKKKMVKTKQREKKERNSAIFKSELREVVAPMKFLEWVELLHGLSHFRNQGLFG